MLIIDNKNTVEPRLSNNSVLDQIGFRPKNLRFLRLRLEHKFGSRPNRKKPSEHERAMMLHMSAFFTLSLIQLSCCCCWFFFYCFIIAFCFVLFHIHFSYSFFKSFRNAIFSKFFVNVCDVLKTIYF